MLIYQYGIYLKVISQKQMGYGFIFFRPVYTYGSESSLCLHIA